MVLDFSLNIEKHTIKAIDKNSCIISINNTTLSSKISPTINLNEVKKAQVKQQQQQLEIEIPVNKNKVKTFTINKPDRLIIDLEGIKKTQTTTNNSSRKTTGEIYPGVTHKKYYLRGPVIVNVIDIDLNNPLIEMDFTSASKNTLFSKKNIRQIVTQEGAIAGINASFFKPPSGLPLGTLISNGEIITGPIFNRVSLVIDDYNKGSIEQVKLAGKALLADNTEIKIQNVNQPRQGIAGVMLYTRMWKSYVPKTLRNEVQIVIKNNKVIKKTLGTLSVPDGSVVITGPNQDSLKALQIGDSVKIDLKYISSKAKIKHAVGGGPYLIKNSEIFIDCKAQKFNFNPYSREPRTAVGLTRDNHLLLVTVDGRQNRSIGMSFYQVANFLKSLGAVQAMNFDGGSSTQMSINGYIVNQPTVRGGASVSTGIIVKPAYDIRLANQIP